MLIERVRDMRKLLSAASLRCRSRSVRRTRLQLQRRDDRNEVGIAAALAKPVERTLDLTRAGTNRGERVRHRLLGIVVGVDADVIARE